MEKNEKRKMTDEAAETAQSRYESQYMNEDSSEWAYWRSNVYKKAYGSMASKTVLFSLYCLLWTVVILGLCMLAVYLSNTSSFVPYLKENSKSIIYSFYCILLFCVIIAVYYYFSDCRALALSGKPFSVSRITLVYVLLISTLVVSYAMGKVIHPYARPFTLITLLAYFKEGVDNEEVKRERETIFLSVIYTLIMFVFDSGIGLYATTGIDNPYVPYNTLVATFISCGITVFFCYKIKTRLNAVLVGILSAVIVCVTFVTLHCCLQLWSDTVMIITYTVMGGIVSASLFFMLFAVLERIFSINTIFRLYELTSEFSGLVKLLRERAPGTYNHSISVAQIAEACAFKIGEDANLARAVSYYHDVGKLRNPELFSENQHGANPHDEMTPELSVYVIRSHVKDGSLLLKKKKMPQIFQDVAEQHHGTMPIKSFYYKAYKLSPGTKVNIADYSYQGKRPQSKLAAIIMICDAAEAAVRSLKKNNPALVDTPEKVRQVIRGIINERLDMAQFDECNITLLELTQICDAITETLADIHHNRVVYPDERLTRKDSKK